MKTLRTWKFWLVLGVATLWIWQANNTIDDSNSILIRGKLTTIATNVLEARGQKFELRGDFVYIDASDREETLNNLSAALNSVQYAGGNTGGMFSHVITQPDRFPVFGENWEPLGYYKNDNVYFVYEPTSYDAIREGDKKGYVRKQHLDVHKEYAYQSARNRDYQALVEAMQKLDERVVVPRETVGQDLPCLGSVSWDTQRPIQVTDSSNR